MTGMITARLSPEELRKNFAGLQFLVGRVVAEATAEIFQVADWELSAHAARPFVEFVHWINSRPTFIARWRSDPETEVREYLRFMKVTDDARSAFAAACYHLKRLSEIEASVNEVLSKYDLASQAPPNGVLGLGRMRQMDFEYHGFVLCCRRSLDYMAWGLSAFFERREGSFKEFGKKLPSWEPSSVSGPLKSAYERHRPKLDFVMDPVRGKSTRDRISHYEFVQAAAINIRSDGHRFVGGGEKLRLDNPDDMRSLSEILTNRAEDIHACLADLLDTFRIAAISHGSSPGP